MKLKLYTYKGCATCRKALKFLADHGVEHVTIPIRETPPSPAELTQMAGIYKGDLRKLFNTSGGTYKEMALKDRLSQMSASDKITLLAQHGNLIKRPFALAGNVGMLGFNEAEWREKLKLDRIT